MAPWAISSLIILATCSYGGTAESGSITWASIPDAGRQVPVRMLDGMDFFPAAELLTRRLVEVELHHCDLGAGYGPGDWPAVFAAMDLPEPMRSWRENRLGYPAEPQP